VFVKLGISSRGELFSGPPGAHGASLGE
jgi:hypothetical protein